MNKAVTLLPPEAGRFGHEATTGAVLRDIMVSERSQSEEKMSNTSTESRTRGCLYGLFIGDALAMPVHWYYDRMALHRDYGQVTGYLDPRNPHPDSIL
jgi:hypothetical protein